MGKGILQQLATEELKFCCMYSFLRATKRWSRAKVAAAMGVHPSSIEHWEKRKFANKLKPCPKCHRPQRTQLRLTTRDDGTPYFVRSELR